MMDDPIAKLAQRHGRLMAERVDEWIFDRLKDLEPDITTDYKTFKENVFQLVDRGYHVEHESNNTSMGTIHYVYALLKHDTPIAFLEYRQDIKFE